MKNGRSPDTRKFEDAGRGQPHQSIKALLYHMGTLQTAPSLWQQTGLVGRFDCTRPTWLWANHVVSLDPSISSPHPGRSGEGKENPEPVRTQGEAKYGQGAHGFEAVSSIQTLALPPYMLLPGYHGYVTNKKPKLQKLCKWQAGSDFVHTHRLAHLLWEALWCWPVSGRQLWSKSDEPGFLTLKGGEGVRVEGGTRLILSAGPQSCSQAGGAGTSLEARRAPPCHLLGGPQGSLSTRGWTHGHRGPRMEEAVADSLGDVSCSRASVHQP